MASTSTHTYWATLSDNELTVHDVHQVLEPVQDDLWVAAACIDRLLDDTAVQEALLHIGIARTQGALERSRGAFSSVTKDTPDTESDNGSDAGKNIDTLVAHLRGTPVDAQLCHMRSVLLERLDRLNTYVEICKEVPDSKEDDVEDELEEWEDDPWADGTAEPSATTRETKPSVRPPVSLSVFLGESLPNSACQLASLQWLGALQILFERHGSHLWPYRLTILESIPEHAHPSQFRDILPSFNATANSERTPSGNPWRPEGDWSELPQVIAAVKQCGGSLGPQPTILAGAGAGAEAHYDLLNAEELSAWYRTRVDQVIASTGMVDIALATVQQGASQGLPGLDELGEELSLLTRLVYDAPQGDQVDDDWTLSRWQSMDPPVVVRAYLAHSTPDSLPKDIARLVMPYLFVLESRAERAGIPDSSLPTRLLYDYILSAPIYLVVAIFEASKPTLPAAQRLIRNDEDIARLALACLYGSDSLDQWTTMSRIFECLPAWDFHRGGVDGEDAADTTVESLGAFVAPSTTHPHCSPSDLLVFFKPLPLCSLSRALDILDVHLESGEILSRWSVPAPLRWFLQSSSDVNEQRAWANRMARRAGGSDDQLNTQEDWEWLLEDMLKLSGKGDTGLNGAFGLLSQLEVTRIFFGGLLSTGKFSIAQGLLHSPKTKFSLDPTTIEDICLSCSREFYDNASSGNYKFGDMKLAYDCLDVPRPSDRIIREKEFIEATSRLSSFNITSRPGIPISPIEIRLTKDRLSLVSRVLSSNNDAYKHTEVILDLVYKLGFRDDATTEVKALAMLADTALQAEDFIRAFGISERMVDAVLTLRASAPMGLDDPRILEASEVCWVACFQLGRQPEFDDLEKKLSLLGRALELCPAEKLHDVLTVWRRLEKDDVENREERLSYSQSGVAGPSGRRRRAIAPTNAASSLRARLQDFHMPSPPLLSTPDAAALASRTFRSVAANFSFSVSSRGRSQVLELDDASSRRSGSQRRSDEDVSAQATRVLQKGIGWLIGADDDV